MKIPVGHIWVDINEDDIRRIQGHLSACSGSDIDTKITDAVLSYFVVNTLRREAGK